MKRRFLEGGLAAAVMVVAGLAVTASLGAQQHADGTPSAGPPAQIVQAANFIVFLYPGESRVIPTDGRGHAPERARDISYLGDAIGRWEGDSLVVESVGFTNATWIASGIRGGGGGYFHSYDMKVTERLRREGNALHYQATVEDPAVLMRPWVMNAYDLLLNPDLNAYVREADQCTQPDSHLFVGRVRH